MCDSVERESLNQLRLQGEDGLNHWNQAKPFLSWLKKKYDLDRTYDPLVNSGATQQPSLGKPAEFIQPCIEHQQIARDAAPPTLALVKEEFGIGFLHSTVYTSKAKSMWVVGLEDTVVDASSCTTHPLQLFEEARPGCSHTRIELHPEKRFDFLCITLGYGPIVVEVALDAFFLYMGHLVARSFPPSEYW